MKQFITVLAILACIVTIVTVILKSKKTESHPGDEKSSSQLTNAETTSAASHSSIEANTVAPHLTTPQACWTTLITAVNSKNVEAINACCTSEEATRLVKMSSEQFREKVAQFDYYQKSIVWPENISGNAASAIVINKAPATYMDFKKIGNRWLCAGTSMHGVNE